MKTIEELSEIIRDDLASLPSTCSPHEEQELIAMHIRKYVSHMEDQKWISVEDRLPDIYIAQLSRNVLAVNGTTQKMAISVYDYEFDSWTHLLDKVTHWQPLPSPPKNVEQ